MDPAFNDYEPRVWTREVNNRFVREYVSGTPVKELSITLGLTVSTLLTRASRKGLPPAGHPLPEGWKVRACMTCRDDFVSEHVGNRRCRECRAFYS